MRTSYSEYTDFADVTVPEGLAEIAEKCFEEDVDYGYVFYQPSTGSVVVTHGDSAEYLDEVEDLLMMVDEVDEVMFEPEAYVHLDSGWFVLLPSDDGWKPAVWTESSERYVTYLK